VEGAVVPWVHPHGRCIVRESASTRAVQVWTLEGTCLWTHLSRSPACSIIADAEGKVFVACSPTLERWERYRHDPVPEQHMRSRSFVRCPGPDGEVRYTWQAPMPYRSRLAMGAAGEVLVTAEGGLWAIG
jgi:hypothetical protein